MKTIRKKNYIHTKRYGANKLKKYDVIYTDEARKSINKIDKLHQKLIKKWIEKNLINCENPRFSGKPLKGKLKKYWRYRIGSYRVIADINDSTIIITIVNIGHRQGVY